MEIKVYLLQRGEDYVREQCHWIQQYITNKQEQIRYFKYAFSPMEISYCKPLINTKPARKLTKGKNSTTLYSSYAWPNFPILQCSTSFLSLGPRLTLPMGKREGWGKGVWSGMLVGSRHSSRSLKLCWFPVGQPRGNYKNVSLANLIGSFNRVSLCLCWKDLQCWETM